MNRAAKLLLSSAIPFVAAGCRPAEEAEVPLPPRPVRTITVASSSQAAPIVFQGVIEAKDAANLAFRIPGRVLDRPVGVGATVQEGQVVARLDPEIELADLRSAKAAQMEAESALRQAAGRFDRVSQLYERGIASRAEFEAAEQASKAANSRVEAALAQTRIASEFVAFTVLKADALGVVTAVGAEPGEVVSAGRPVVRVARRDGRDAVFDVPAGTIDQVADGAVVNVTAPGDPTVSAKGRVREVSPQADPVTRLFRVRVGLTLPPPSFRLGVAVQGSLLAADGTGTTLPVSALVRKGTGGAVWVVDPSTGVVAQRSVELASEDPASIVVARGLSPGDIVVTAGAASLKSGQKVRLAGGEP